MIILGWPLSAVLTVIIVKIKGYDPVPWLLGSVVFGVFSLIVAIIIPFNNTPSDK